MKNKENKFVYINEMSELDFFPLLGHPITPRRGPGPPNTKVNIFTASFMDPNNLLLKSNHPQSIQCPFCDILNVDL